MSTHVSLQAAENHPIRRACHSELALASGASEESALFPMRLNSRFLAVLGMTNLDVVPQPGLDIWAAWEEALALPSKARGEVAEMVLVPKLMAMGMIVAKPFGDSSPWDLLVQAGDRLRRLQVRSVWKKGARGYLVNSGRSVAGSQRRRCYRPNEIDFLAVYIVPEDAWFLLPVRRLRRANLLIKTDPECRFARYRDRWDLLYGRKRPPRSIDPCLSALELVPKVPELPQADALSG